MCPIRCAKQCCTNKKDMCLRGIDHDGTLCAKEADPAECCDGKHENCLLHAANGRNCAYSPLCSEQEMDEARQTFADKADAKVAGGAGNSGNDGTSKAAAAAASGVSAAATSRANEKTAKEGRAEQAQAAAQASQELSSSANAKASATSLRNLRDVVEPCAKECCTNKKDMCLKGADRDGTDCKHAADPGECCEGRLDSCSARATTPCC